MSTELISPDKIYPRTLKVASELKTVWQSGSCSKSPPDPQEVYNFNADYKEQGVTTSGAFVMSCGGLAKNKKVEVKTFYGSTYNGMLFFHESGRPWYMKWDKNYDVRWIIEF